MPSVTTLPEYEQRTPAALITLNTSPHIFDAGVRISARVHVFEPNNDAGLIPDDQHTAHVGFTFNLTPDECDALAAALVAYAFDRRRVEAQREEVAA